MPTRLLPAPERLRPVLLDPAAAVELLCFLRTDGDPRAVLRERLSEVGGRIGWLARNELLAIGKEPMHWTHTVIVHVARADRLLAAADGDGLSVDASDVQVYLLQRRHPPALLLRAWRVLRLIGRRFEGDDEGLADVDLGGHEEPSLHPRPDQIRQLATAPRQTPAYMINLLRYRERAAYRVAVRRAKVSGRRAYERYGLVAVRSVYMLGGELLHMGHLGTPLVDGTATAAGGRWDDLAIVRYPSPRHLLKLARMPGYLASLRHRQAGLERTALLVGDALG
jgi:uncharacterized protein (DUF1330 family)